MIKLALILVCLVSLTACKTATQAANTSTEIGEITAVKTAALLPTASNTKTPPRETTTPAATASPSTVESTPVITEEPEFVRPSSHLISPITGERQAYALSCESRAAVDWAAYYGFSILEAEFQFNLPFSDNPDLGFVGVTTGKWGQVPPYDYGVHAAPVAGLLREYGVPAFAVKGSDLETLKDSVARDHPVLTWVIGNVVGGVPHIYTDSQGNQVTVAAYEHVVIVIGYNDETDTITYMNNGRYYETPSSVFDNSWSVLERMAIYHENGAEQ